MRPTCHGISHRSIETDRCEKQGDKAKQAREVGKGPLLRQAFRRRAGLDSPADEQPKNVLAWIEEICGTEEEANLDSFCSELNQLVECLLLVVMRGMEGRGGLK